MKRLSTSAARVDGVHGGSHRVITPFQRQQAFSHAHIRIAYSLFSHDMIRIGSGLVFSAEESGENISVYLGDGVCFQKRSDLHVGG